MAQTLPISVFIIALNEGDRIARTIDSARGLADEIVVIDSGSSDNTKEAAQAAGARVYFNAWDGYGKQKRFGEEQCKNDWLLNLDADEILSPQLVEEIRALFAANPEKHAGYRLRICNMLPGETRVPRFTQVNEVLRLYDKKQARFSESPVHDSVIVQQGSVATLKSPVYHPSFRSLAHAVDKANRYSSMQAEDMLRKPQILGTARLYVEFPVSFIKAYFFRLYVFRGARGFSYAMVYAFSRFLRLAKWHEARNKRP